jgi:hypothetical protein
MSFFKKLTTTAFMACLMLLVGVSSLPHPVSADIQAGCDRSVAFLKLPTWYAYLDIGPERTKDDGGAIIDKCAIIGPTKTDDAKTEEDESKELDLAKVIPLVGLAVLEIMLRIAGLAGLFFVIYGGFKYITSQGEPDKTKQSRQTITNALIGIVISIIAAAAVSFIANTLTTAK